VHDVVVDGTTGSKAALVFTDSPLEGVAGHIRLDWDTMTWFEEDEPIFVHPRNPSTRVDILPSSRHVEVRLGDAVLADTHRAHALFETGLPTRWYLPQVDVRMDLLVPSGTVTHCPYKGTASYLSARVDGETTPDVAWTYRTPLPESQRIVGLISFYPDRVKVLVDGEQVS
jgi:uncharacterized protein (DUF427 family)